MEFNMNILEKVLSLILAIVFLMITMITDKEETVILYNSHTHTHIKCQVRGQETDI